jgi:transcriptional/translational regulatory protein YebC/TACO1
MRFQNSGNNMGCEGSVAFQFKRTASGFCAGSSEEKKEWRWRWVGRQTMSSAMTALEVLTPYRNLKR